MKKVLIADDENRMRRLVADFFKRQGFATCEADNGLRALEVFFDNPGINLVILDVMMPGYDGWTVCREIRKFSHVPIIMLTARAEESDQLFGFDLGVDEYITKPFSPRLLVARALALLRRAENLEGAGRLVFDDLEIDNARHCVSLSGKILDLSPKEYELLLYLASNEGRALSREQILNAVWDYNYVGDIRTVDTHIKKLRLKLGERGEFIQTVRGLGYRFEAIG